MTRTLSGLNSGLTSGRGRLAWLLSLVPDPQACVPLPSCSPGPGGLQPDSAPISASPAAVPLHRKPRHSQQGPSASCHRRPPGRRGFHRVHFVAGVCTALPCRWLPPLGFSTPKYPGAAPLEQSSRTATCLGIPSCPRDPGLCSPSSGPSATLARRKACKFGGFSLPSRRSHPGQQASSRASVKPKPQSAEHHHSIRAGRHGNPWLPRPTHCLPPGCLLTQLPALPDWTCCPGLQGRLLSDCPRQPTLRPSFPGKTSEIFRLAKPFCTGPPNHVAFPPHGTDGPHIYFSRCSGLTLGVGTGAKLMRGLQAETPALLFFLFLI